MKTGSLLLFSITFFSLMACGGSDMPAPMSAEERLALPADVAMGQALFRECKQCHTATPGGPNMIGPNLHDVVGRQAGGKADFAYSTAMKRAEFTWDDTHLDQWLEQPQALVPGNRMAYRGNPNPADRRDLIAYLASLSEE
ncbi:cytochrome c family protein [Parvularcula sp. LCG005]|uniref:c-type cytochrome n=1 Tax=Parvularcula sp. LCG005 TaxID=3078805 RepID=UPI00294334F5|nr:cytochrome c family protein [Parvularcula sp. LCG005]WOI54021.1 cytochrome c family protein [Parvularcula sp. LCG005]